MLKVLHIGPVVNRLCSFGWLDIRLPPRVMCIEVSNNDRFLWKWDIADTSFHSSLIVACSLGLFIIDVKEECR